MEPRKTLRLWLKLSSEDGVKCPKEKENGEASSMASGSLIWWSLLNVVQGLELEMLGCQ